MASVKEDLDEKTFSELSEEGKSLSLEQLGAFENKVKAFAYEATKKNKEQNDSDTDDIMKFGATDNSEEYHQHDTTCRRWPSCHPRSSTQTDGRDSHGSKPEAYSMYKTAWADASHSHWPRYPSHAPKPDGPSAGGPHH